MTSLSRANFTDSSAWSSCGRFALLPSPIHNTWRYYCRIFSSFLISFIVETYKNRYHDEHWPLYYNLKQNKIRNRVKNAGRVGEGEKERSIYRFLCFVWCPTWLPNSNNNRNYSDGLCCVYILLFAGVCGLERVFFHVSRASFSLHASSKGFGLWLKEISNITWGGKPGRKQF